MSDELIEKLIDEQRKTREEQREIYRLLFELNYNNMPPDALLTREQVAIKFKCAPSSVGRTEATRTLVAVEGGRLYVKREVDALIANLRRDVEREAAKILSGRK